MSLDPEESNTRIAKAAVVMSELKKRVWSNNKINRKHWTMYLPDIRLQHTPLWVNRWTGGIAVSRDLPMLHTLHNQLCMFAADNGELARPDSRKSWSYQTMHTIELKLHEA